MRLGHRIVHELGLEDSVDTLGRWMAHRLAELIEAGENDNQQAREEATDLVLRLWEHRSDWPDGWPPPNTEAVRKALQPPSPYKDEEAGDKRAGPWLGRLSRLARLQQEEVNVWRQLGLLELDLPEELDQVDPLDQELSEEERSLFVSLKMSHELAVRHFIAELGDRGEDPEARVELAKRELRALGRKRGVLLRGAAEEFVGKTER